MALKYKILLKYFKYFKFIYIFTLRIMNCYPSHSSATPLFRKFNICDNIKLHNFFYARDAVRDDLPRPLPGGCL